MRKFNSGRVRVLEDAFELNLAKLMRASKLMGQSLLTVSDGTTTGLVMIEPTQLTFFLGGVAFVAEIVCVPCLKDGSRPLLKCPCRAHEGNYQSLYYCGGELACRSCHDLKYRSNLASCAADRAQLARFKLLKAMGGEPGSAVPERKPYAWRKRHQRLTAKLAMLTSMHYQAIRAWLKRNAPV